jgi:hypothetical protein
MKLFWINEKLVVNADRIDAIVLSEHADVEVMIDIAGNQYPTGLFGRVNMRRLCEALEKPANERSQ